MQTGAQGIGGVIGVKRAKTGHPGMDFGRFSYSGGSGGARRPPASFSAFSGDPGRASAQVGPVPWPLWRTVMDIHGSEQNCASLRSRRAEAFSA